MRNNLLQDEGLIQDFIDVTIEVLSTMASLEVKSTGHFQIENHENSLDVTACMDITGVLGFSGGRRGSVLVTFSREMALNAVGGMLGIELEEIDGDVTDGIGELVNMIAGGAKTRLQAKGIDFDLSIPNTVLGKAHQITAPAGTSRTRMGFESAAGSLFLEVYLKQEARVFA